MTVSKLTLRIKQAAERLGKCLILERDTFSTNVSLGQTLDNNDGHDVQQLRDALFCVFNRPEPITHQIAQEPVLLEERMAFIESKVASGEVLVFESLLRPIQGRHGYGRDVYGHFRVNSSATYSNCEFRC